MPRNQTTFKKGKPGGPGRPKMTEEQKREARLKRAADYDFKAECRALLPIATDQVLETLEKRGFKKGELVRVTEMLRDTVHGKPAQTIQGAGGGPLVGSFTMLLASVDGSKVEKLHGEALAHGNGKPSGNGNGHEKL